LKQFFNTLNNAFEVNNELLRIAECQSYRNKYKNKIIECKQNLDSIYEEYEKLKEKVLVYDQEYHEMIKLLQKISEKSNSIHLTIQDLTSKFAVPNYHRNESSLIIIDNLVLQSSIVKGSNSLNRVTSNISTLDNSLIIDDRLHLTPQNRLEILLKYQNIFFSIPINLEDYIKKLTVNFTQSAMEAFCFRLAIHFQNQPNEKILTREILSQIANNFNIFLGSYNIPKMISCTKEISLRLNMQRINYTGRILVDLSNQDFTKIQLEYDENQRKFVEEKIFEKMIICDILAIFLRTSVELNIKLVQLFDSCSFNKQTELNSMIIFDAGDIMKFSHDEIANFKSKWIVVISDNAFTLNKFRIKFKL
jgi:hypothetical protein